MTNNRKFFRIITAFLSVCWITSLGFIRLQNVRAQDVPVSKGECVMEVDSRRVLYARSADTRLPMASTTKIVTCITVLQLCDNLDEKVCIPKEAAGVEGSSVYLKEGETYTIRDLLYGLMLRSGNDCAVALALHCQSSIARFAKKMNEFAESAGALCSHFENPHGLPDKNHYTTAQDLALITCAAMKNPTFCEIVSTKYYEPKNWYNKNKMLTLYDGATGVKTGFTKEAGRCLVSAAKRENMRVVCVVLNSPMMYERSAELLSGAFQTYKMTKLISKGETISDGRISGRSETDFYYPLCDGEVSHVERQIRKYNSTNNKKIVGQFEIYLTKRLLFSANLYKL